VKKKLKFIVPVVVLLVAGLGAKMTVLAPKKADAKPPKVNGTLVALSPEFIVNLAGGHYGKLSVAVLLSSPPPAASAAAGGTSPTLPEDAVVRAVITNALTGLESTQLIDRAARQRVLDDLTKQLQTKTDEPITQVMITDLAVQ
jgi:flagellar basal body-associated protein FliL